MSNIGGAYIDPIVKKVIDLLEANGPEELKGKYYYRPVFYEPGKDILPVVMVSNAVLRSSEYAAGGISKHIKGIEVTILADWTEEPVNWNTAGYGVLDKLIEPRDDNYQLTGGLLKVIEDNKALDQEGGLTIAVDPNPEIVVNREPVANRRGEGIWSIEGSIIFAVQLN